jgi:hypothetical protein
MRRPVVLGVPVQCAARVSHRPRTASIRRQGRNSSPRLLSTRPNLRHRRRPVCRSCLGTANGSRRCVSEGLLRPTACAVLCFSFGPCSWPAGRRGRSKKRGNVSSKPWDSLGRKLPEKSIGHLGGSYQCWRATPSTKPNEPKVAPDGFARHHDMRA